MGVMPDAPPPASETALHRLLLALLAVLALAGLAPLFAAGVVYRFFHSERVFALAAIGMTGAVVPGLLALRAARRTAASDDAPRALALWGACLVAALSALASVTLTAQTMLPWLVVQAQRNTLPYAVTQPLALLVFVIGVALALDRGALGVVAPRALAVPLAALKGLGAGLVVAIWFLEGGAGPHPGPWWILVKTLAMAAVILVLAWRLERVPPARRFVLAWIVALAGCANVLATLEVLARMGGGAGGS